MVDHFNLERWCFALKGSVLETTGKAKKSGRELPGTGGWGKLVSACPPCRGRGRGGSSDQSAWRHGPRCCHTCSDSRLHKPTWVLVSSTRSVENRGILKVRAWVAAIIALGAGPQGRDSEHHGGPGDDRQMLRPNEGFCCPSSFHHRSGNAVLWDHCQFRGV